MTAVDTNLLVYAAIASSPRHRVARGRLAELAESAEPWAIPWPCVYEFLRVATHPRVYRPPMTLAAARAFLAALFDSPTLVLLGETPRHAEVLAALLDQADVTGNLLHDAHIAALCREHGVSQLLTADRDFLRFPGLGVTDPFRD